MAPLLDVRNLETQFRTQDGVVKAVNNVSFYVNRSETLGIVGESGSGKSVTSLSLMRLIPSPPGQITGGEVWFDGQDLLKLSEDKMRELRGNRIALGFGAIWAVPCLGTAASFIARGVLYFLMVLFFVLQPKYQLEDRRKYFLC